MRKLSRISTAVLLLTGTLFFWGCASSYKPVEVSHLVWPSKPEKTRARMVKYIMSDLDIRTPDAAEKLFGEDVTFRFSKPHGIAVDDEGNIYITDSVAHRVNVINLTHGSIREIPNPYGWGTPLGIAVDNKNKLVAVADAARASVYIFNKDGFGIKTVIGQGGEFKSPFGIAIDPDRQIVYVADVKKHEIESFTFDGKKISTVAPAGDAPGEVYFPSLMTTDGTGRLYVVDTMNFRFQIIDPEGGPAKAYGEHGNRPGMFARPKGVAVTKDGYVLVTDAAFGNFQIFDKNGNVYLAVGAGGKNFGDFQIPQGIAVDNNDMVYVVDQVNQRIQIFQLYTDEYYKAQEAAGVTTEDAPKK